jgi:hypothetical protein
VLLSDTHMWQFKTATLPVYLQEGHLAISCNVQQYEWRCSSPRRWLAETEHCRGCQRPPHHSLSSCCRSLLLPVNFLRQPGASFIQSKPLSPLQTVSVLFLGSHSGSSASRALLFRNSTRWSRVLSFPWEFCHWAQNTSSASYWRIWAFWLKALRLTASDICESGVIIVASDRSWWIFNHLVNNETNKKMSWCLEQGV